MCPLRLILIFLSATLAGFFVLRNLKSHPGITELDPSHDNAADGEATASVNRNSSTSKVCGVITAGFWTCVDMASGRYLWRNLVSSSSPSPSSSKSSTMKRHLFKKENEWQTKESGFPTCPDMSCNVLIRAPRQICSWSKQ